MVAIIALAVIVVVLLVWTAQSRQQPAPIPPPTSSAPFASKTPHPLGTGAVFIQTAVPGPEDAANRIFELYRDHYLLD